MVGNAASLGSQQMIWQNDDKADIWHQGGDMHFGPDGKLYVAVGDHLLPNSSQSLTSYNGKILRMNADGSAPTDNPFYDGSGPNKDAIWALGFRKPVPILVRQRQRPYLRRRRRPEHLGGGRPDHPWRQLRLADVRRQLQRPWDDESDLHVQPHQP